MLFLTHHVQIYHIWIKSRYMESIFTHGGGEFRVGILLAELS